MKYLSNKIIKHQLKKEFNNVINSLSDFTEEQKQSQLHDLRVSIKKIKAVTAIIDKTNKNNVLKNDISKLSHLFKEVGTIRSSFINLSISKNYFPAEIQLLTLQLEINELSEKLISNRKKHLNVVSKIKKNVIGKKIKCEIKKIQKAINNLINELTICIYLIPYNYEILHDIRKQLKYILYFINCFRVELNRILKINITYLNELQEIIGNWHDVELTMQMIKNKFPDNASVNKTITQEVKKQLAFINNKLQNFEMHIKIHSN